MISRKMLQLQPTTEAHTKWKTVASHRGISMVQLFEDMANVLYADMIRGMASGQPDTMEEHASGHQVSVSDRASDPSPGHNSSMGSTKERKDIHSS